MCEVENVLLQIALWLWVFTSLMRGAQLIYYNAKYKSDVKKFAEFLVREELKGYKS